MVVLCRIDVVLEALVKRQADFAGRPKLFASKHTHSDLLNAKSFSLHHAFHFKIFLVSHHQTEEYSCF